MDLYISPCKTDDHQYCICNIMALGTVSFTVFECKTKIIVGCQICCTYIHQSPFTIINITVHIK